MHHPEDIGKKQDIIVRNNTACTKVTIWEDDIRKMSIGKSYKLTGMWVREFRAMKYSTTAKTECEIMKLITLGCEKL